MSRPASSPGSVLALVVLVLVALQLLAHGVLLMTRSERAASMAAVRLLQARAAADAGALAVQEESVQGWDSVALFQEAHTIEGSLPGLHTFRGRAQRLSREYWLAEGRGRARGEAWDVTVRYLLWRLDPLGRVAAATGAAEVGGALLGPGVAFDPERPAFCREWKAGLDSVAAPETWGRVSPGVSSTVGEPSLGRLGPNDLASALPRLLPVSGTPEPDFRWGRCDDEASWNWGDPSHPEAPCGDRVVAWFAPGDLRLHGGEGQGVLAVGGSLELRGTHFDGVVLTGGGLTLREGAEVRGMVRVGGDLDLAGESRVLGSPCRVVRTLAAFQRRLGRRVRVQEAGAME